MSEPNGIELSERSRNHVIDSNFLRLSFTVSTTNTSNYHQDKSNTMTNKSTVSHLACTKWPPLQQGECKVCHLTFTITSICVILTQPAKMSHSSDRRESEIVVSYKLVLNAIRSFPNASAGRTDGLSLVYLKDLVQLGSGPAGLSLVDALCRFCQLLLDGNVSHAFVL
ncbi:hypothetical protein GJ496_000021 [Pomphorhynchus laevis]|nr:hypothetical protein GJ496_000021 [Pomphorhynchus laevis]